MNVGELHPGPIDLSTGASLPGGWLHEDGTPCPESFLVPDNGMRWWCAEHRQFLTREG